MLVGMHPHLHDVFSRLDQSRAALAAAVDTIAPPLRQQRPDADRWSAAEVLEHLSIVERIVVEHGGEITFEDAPDGGALFVVKLPLSGPTLLPEPPRESLGTDSWHR